MCALRCPDGGGHDDCALLLPRVYLQTVTLMQCNDYFYFRYFGSLFPLSGMAPYWPTDYLCGCCHTWLLQLSSLSTVTPWEPFHFITIPSPLSQQTFNSGLHLHFVFFSLVSSLCYIFTIPSPPQSLHLYSSTPPDLTPWFQPADCICLCTFVALKHWNMLLLLSVCEVVCRGVQMMCWMAASSMSNQNAHEVKLVKQ